MLRGKNKSLRIAHLNHIEPSVAEIRRGFHKFPPLLYVFITTGSLVFVLDNGNTTRSGWIIFPIL
jgi:hypothetical protein